MADALENLEQQENAEQEPVAEAPAETSTPSEPVQEQQAPDIGEQMAALTQEVQGLRSRLAPEPEQPNSLYERLSQQSEESSPGYDDYGYEQPQQTQGQPEQQFDPLEDIIRERVAEEMAPMLTALEADRRTSQLEALADQHPELRESDMQEAIYDRLAPLAQRYGNDMIVTDPELVKAALIAEKAERTSASEVPAEQAANQGARLETNAGAAAQEAQLSPDDQIKKDLLGLSGGGDAFT